MLVANNEGKRTNMNELQITHGHINKVQNVDGKPLIPPFQIYPPISVKLLEIRSCSSLHGTRLYAPATIYMRQWH